MLLLLKIFLGLWSSYFLILIPCLVAIVLILLLTYIILPPDLVPIRFWSIVLSVHLLRIFIFVFILNMVNKVRLEMLDNISTSHVHALVLKVERKIERRNIAI